MVRWSEEEFESFRARLATKGAPSPKARVRAGKGKKFAPDGSIIDDEETRQKQLFTYLRMIEEDYPVVRWIHHVPQGKRAQPALRAQLYLMGVRTGVPDICCPVKMVDDDYPYAECPGMVGEMKAPGGAASKAQDEWLTFYDEQGWMAKVWFTADAAFNDLCEYLRIPCRIEGDRLIQ